MGRLVDIDKSIEVLKSNHPNMFTAQIDYAQGYRDCLDDIAEETPTVEERKHSHWEYWCGRLPRFPACGYEYTDLVECKNYCGNCGAEMDDEVTSNDN